MSCHADEMGDFSPDRSGADECHQPSGGVGEERGSEGGGGGGRRQKKKKKRRQREEMYDVLEAQGPQDENHSPAGVYPGGEWELDEGGRIGARGKKGKSRKRIPEEWSALQESSQGPAGGPTTSPGADPWSTDALSQEGPVGESRSLQDSPAPAPAPAGADESPSTPSTLSSEAPPSVLASLDSYLEAGEESCDPCMETDEAPPPSGPAHPLTGSLQETGPVEKAVEDPFGFGSLLESSTDNVSVSAIPPLSQSPNPFLVPSPTQTPVPPSAPPLSPTPREDSPHAEVLIGYSPPPATAEAPPPKDDPVVSANHSEPLLLSPALTPHPSSQTVVGSSSATSGSFPLVSSALNPAAPPFFPSQSEYGEPRLEGWREDEGLTDSSVAEGW